MHSIHFKHSCIQEQTKRKKKIGVMCRVNRVHTEYPTEFKRGIIRIEHNKFVKNSWSMQQTD